MNSGAGHGVYGSNSSTGYAGYFQQSSTGYAAVFMGGNVGIGNATPPAPLFVRATATSAIAEPIATFDVTDGSGSFVQIANFSAVNAVMEPGIRGNMIGSTNSFMIQGITNNDAAGGPMILMDSKASAASLAVKPLFGISNNSTMKLLVDATGNLGLGTNAPQSTLHVVGSVQNSVNIQNASYTLTNADYIVLKNAATPITYTLPAPTIALIGRVYMLLNTNAAGLITISTTGLTGVTTVPVNSGLTCACTSATSWHCW